MLPRDAIKIHLTVENLEGRRYVLPPYTVLVVAEVDGFDWMQQVDSFLAREEVEIDYSDIPDDTYHAIESEFCDWLETQSAHTKLRAAALMAGMVC